MTLIFFGNLYVFLSQFGQSTSAQGIFQSFRIIDCTLVPDVVLTELRVRETARNLAWSLAAGFVARCCEYQSYMYTSVLDILKKSHTR